MYRELVNSLRRIYQNNDTSKESTKKKVLKLYENKKISKEELNYILMEEGE